MIQMGLKKFRTEHSLKIREPIGVISMCFVLGYSAKSRIRVKNHRIKRNNPSNIS